MNIIAFSDTVQSELLRLADGDSVSIQGALKVETYTAADGTTKVSLSIIANHVLALRQPPKARKPAAAQDTRPRQDRCAGTWTADSGDFNDSIDCGGEP